MACDTFSFCSQWEVVGNRVTTLPAATGGSIPSGTYVLVEVLSEVGYFDKQQEVIHVDGDRYRSHSVGGTQTGRLTTSGNQVSFDGERNCGILGADYGESDEDNFVYEYTSDGNRLTVFLDPSAGLRQNTGFYYEGQGARVALVYQATTAGPCEIRENTACDQSSCSCAVSEGSPLTESQCGW